MSLQTLPSLDIRHFLNGHVVDVFETMLSMKATPVPDGPPPEFAERIDRLGRLGRRYRNRRRVSPPVGGFCQSNRRHDAGIAAGRNPRRTTEVNDVIGECTNMLAGGLKSVLCDKGYECAVSTPAIIRGTSFAIESLPDVRHEVDGFRVRRRRFAVEVHIKFASNRLTTLIPMPMKILSVDDSRTIRLIVGRALRSVRLCPVRSLERRGRPCRGGARKTRPHPARCHHAGDGRRDDADQIEGRPGAEGDPRHHAHRRIRPRQRDSHRAPRRAGLSGEAVQGRSAIGKNWPQRAAPEKRGGARGGSGPGSVAAAAPAA